MVGCCHPSYNKYKTVRTEGEEELEIKEMAIEERVEVKNEKASKSGPK